MYVPQGIVNQSKINAAVSEVIRELSPYVQRIRFDIGPDSVGQWAIFFRVLLSDEASSEKNLREIAPQVVWKLSERIDLPEHGLFPYFNFRSHSEQATVNEPGW